MKFHFTYLALFLFLGHSQLSSQEKTADLSIHFEISDELKASSADQGRLFLFFTTNPASEPRKQIFPSPGNQSQIYAINLDDLKFFQKQEINDFSDWFGTPDWSLDEIPEGKYYVQALWSQNESESQINAPGNWYSEKKEVELIGKTNISFKLVQLIAERTLVENEMLKYVEIKSDTLSEWWGKPMYLKASILLPHNYQGPKEAYPIRYNVAGFSGRYDRVNRLVKDEDFMNWWTSDQAPQLINVFLDGEGPFGDSYQMDSDNSGPYGYALINELIPYIEKMYRGTEDPEKRFVDGCSTGGWVSLALQLYYPESFNGVFSYSPDAVEFENYQLINIYRDKNAYVNEFGYLRPVMRDTKGEPIISLKDFIRYENVLGSSDTYVNSGEQIGAHTALYSPKGADGLPMPLFDAYTGEIDPAVAEAWKKYDFKLYAQENWESLGPKIQGKIYLWMGDMDNFYLNQASREFSEFLQTTENPSSDAEMVFSPMEGHCTQFSHRKVLEQMQDRLKEMEGQ